MDVLALSKEASEYVLSLRLFLWLLLIVLCLIPLNSTLFKLLLSLLISSSLEEEVKVERNDLWRVLLEVLTASDLRVLQFIKHGHCVFAQRRSQVLHELC